MADKYQALREAAEKAAPGLWAVEVMPSGKTTVTAGQLFVAGDNCDAGLEPANAGYIAAANPAAIQALLAERDALRTALQTAQNGLRWYCDEYPEQVYECDHEAMAQIDAALSQ